jgi:hypothetical protein
VGETAKKTLVGALVAWLLTRALRRLVAIALLAGLLGGGLAIAERHGVDVGGVGRVIGCERRAVVRAAKQLRSAALTSASPIGARRQLHALRRLGHCPLHSAPAHRRERPRP